MGVRSRDGVEGKVKRGAGRKSQVEAGWPVRLLTVVNVKLGATENLGIGGRGTECILKAPCFDWRMMLER
jgi:hypothetical protein